VKRAPQPFLAQNPATFLMNLQAPAGRALPPMLPPMLPLVRHNQQAGRAAINVRQTMATRTEKLKTRHPEASGPSLPHGGDSCQSPARQPSERVGVGGAADA